MIEQLESWDQELLLFLNSLRADWLDQPMFAMTKMWFWIPILAFLVYALYKKYPGGKQFMVIVLGIALTVAASDLISYRLFKLQIKRYRPTHHLVIGEQVQTVTDFDGNEYRGGKYGFLSSHATNYFGIATFVFIMLGRARKYRWLFIWAALIAYTRIYLGVHYPSDILCGAILGILIALGTTRLTNLGLQYQARNA
ncbi:phosphatase PAP2 family protein [Sanyastnella coralliicola]|uniref:phosphatase PAP2 family protein n=1 Tax=Sanyastnella coralliicola TaxID=3069118 RepID=UPI0027B905F1|nr:phosphatase PAP2 family protein [Longitalea sp. SCSIO 12813]